MTRDVIGQNQEPGTPFDCSMWFAGNRVLRPLSDPFLSLQPGSLNRNGAARNSTGTLICNASFVSGVNSNSLNSEPQHRCLCMNHA